jgi:hypothetical protein
MKINCNFFLTKQQSCPLKHIQTIVYQHAKILLTTKPATKILLRFRTKNILKHIILSTLEKRQGNFYGCLFE